MPEFLLSDGVNRTNNKSGRFDELESLKISNRLDTSQSDCLISARCISVALDYLGLLSPE